MLRILITGANRGIGLEFTSQYLRRGDRVFATCRRPDAAKELQTLGSDYPKRLTIVGLDVADPSSISQSYSMVRVEIDALDLLINNAGVYSTQGSLSPGESLGTLSFDDMLFVMRTNAAAPLIVIQQYLDLLRTSKRARIVNMTSGYGSISNNASGFPYYYGASKAALNQLTRSLAADVRSSGMIAVVLDPGWVATDMGGSHAPLSPYESVKDMIEVIENLSIRKNGQFLNRKGQLESW